MKPLVPALLLALALPAFAGGPGKPRPPADLFLTSTAFVDGVKRFSVQHYEIFGLQAGVTLFDRTQAKLGAILLPVPDPLAIYSLYLKQNLYRSEGNAFAAAVNGSFYYTGDDEGDLRFRSKESALVSYQPGIPVSLHGGIGIQWGRYRDPDYDHYENVYGWKWAPAWSASAALSIDEKIDFIAETFNDGEDYGIHGNYRSGFADFGLKFHGPTWSVDLFFIPIAHGSGPNAYVAVPGLAVELRF